MYEKIMTTCTWQHKWYDISRQIQTQSR